MSSSRCQTSIVHGEVPTGAHRVTRGFLSFYTVPTTRVGNTPYGIVQQLGVSYTSFGTLVHGDHAVVGIP